MIKSKFISIYTSLSKFEVKQLQKWLRSPIHNQHQDVIKLFDYLNSRTKITPTTVDKKRVFKYLFPTDTYNDLRLRHIQSYALEILENFVGYNRIFLDRFLWHKKQAQSYRQRKLTKISRKTLDKAEDSLEKTTLENSDVYFQRYQLEAERFLLGATGQRTKANNLPLLLGHLSQFFVMTTLKYACTAASHRNVFKTEYSIPLLEAVLEFANSEQATKSTQIYYLAYQSMTHPKEAFYKELKQTFFEHLELFNAEEQYELFQINVNYCIKQINTGNTVYFEEVFELFKKGLKTEILLDNGVLSPFTYKNMVSAALKLGEYQWVEQFIEQYTKALPNLYQSNYEAYNRAKLYYMQGQNDAAQRLLLQVDLYDDLYLILDAKMLLLKIYYEDASIDALMALIASFNVFLQRKEVMGYHKQVYKNILRLVNKFLNAIPKDKDTKEQLRAEIAATQPLVEQNWLLEQVERI